MHPERFIILLILNNMYKIESTTDDDLPSAIAPRANIPDSLISQS